MAERTEYRSSKRSKAMIKKAFAKLLHEKDISKISVTNIVEAAEISRGTFYAHYRDVYSLFEQIENEELEKLIELIDEMGYDMIISSPKAFLKETLEYIEKDIEYYRMLFLSNSATHFIEAIKLALEEKIFDESNSYVTTVNKTQTAIQISFFVAGLSTSILNWLHGDFDASLDELSDVLSDIMRKTFSFGYG